VQEKVKQWRQKFGGPLGSQVRELTGDSDVASWEEMHDVDLIVTTPEKFDSVTRRNKQRGGMAFFAEVALLLIDEVHLLNEDRGPALEIVVSRMKMISKMHELKDAPISNIRFVACSATIPNAADIGAWLGAPPAFVKSFGEEHRPVRLSTRIIAYKSSKNDFLFDKKLTSYVFHVVKQFYDGKPALVFCSTRAGAQETAKKLCESAEAERTGHPFLLSPSQRSEADRHSASTLNKTLQSYVRQGVAFHHGGMAHSDRTLVEKLFEERNVMVICTTSTLALCVNLPAHLVVVKVCS
jgi:ATP-dependent DNA helicase HFM1/MER3